MCSRPPSEVGTGIIAFDCVDREPSLDKSFDKGRKYRYIWVVNRLGMLTGVTQRVNGMRPSSRHQYLLLSGEYIMLENVPISGLPPFCCTHDRKLTELSCTA